MHVPPTDCAALALSAMSEFIAGNDVLCALSEQQLLAELTQAFCACGRTLDTYTVAAHLSTLGWPMCDEALDGLAVGWDAVRL